MSSGNISEVTKDRFVLNFTIRKSMSINVSRIIHNSISNMIKHITTVGSGHPFLIYALCIEARAMGNRNEEVILPHVPHTKRSIGVIESKLEVG